MAFAQVLSDIEQSFNTMSTTHNIALGATWDAGDCIVIRFVGSQVGADQVYTITDIPDFTEVLDAQFNVAGENRQHIWIGYKEATGAEDSTTVNAATSASVSGVARVMRLQAGTWQEIEASTVVQAEAANPNPPDFSPSWGAADTLWEAICTFEDSDFEATVAPASYTGLNSTISDSTEDAVLSTARRELNAASENPGTFTAASEKHQALVLAISPLLVVESGTTGQEGYRFRNDDGDEDGATWMAVQDVPMLMGLRNTSPTPGGPGTLTPRRFAGENVTTGDMYIVAHIRPDNATHTGAILCRFSAAPFRAFYFMIRSDGALLFGYSNDGTTVVDLAADIQWHSASHSYPIEIGSAVWMAVSHEPGAATRVTKFYVAPARELLPAHQLGADVVFGTTGIVFDPLGTDYTINMRDDGGFHFEGDIYSVELYAGLDDTAPQLLSPRFWDPVQGWRWGMTGGEIRQDDQSNPWTIDADHAILGAISQPDSFRLRTLANAETNDPPTQTGTLMVKRVDEPDSEWRGV